MSCSLGLAGSAASLPSHSRVARISRVIGNFDTTAKAFGWQERIIAPLGSGVTARKVTPQHFRDCRRAKAPTQVAFSLIRRPQRQVLVPGVEEKANSRGPQKICL
jgi:hypothetical protein